LKLQSTVLVQEIWEMTCHLRDDVDGEHASVRRVRIDRFGRSCQI